MNRPEINFEIQKILSNLSDENLQAALTYLQQLEKENTAALSLSKHLGKVLQEDHELLKKLAQ